MRKNSRIERENGIQRVELVIWQQILQQEKSWQIKSAEGRKSPTDCALHLFPADCGY